MGVTARLALRYPELIDIPNGPLAVQNLAEDLDTIVVDFGSGPKADMPPASGPLTLWIATDTQEIWATTGTQWLLISPGAVPDRSITRQKIALDAVGPNEIDAGAVEYIHITDGAVTLPKIDENLRPFASGADVADGDLALRSLGTGAKQAAKGLHGSQHLPQGLDPVIRAGTRAAMPAAAAGNNGWFYWANDQRSLNYSDGIGWRRVGPECGDIVLSHSEAADIPGWIKVAGQAWPSMVGAYLDLYTKWGGATLPNLAGPATGFAYRAKL